MSIELERWEINRLINKQCVYCTKSLAELPLFYFDKNPVNIYNYNMHTFCSEECLSNFRLKYPEKSREMGKWKND